MDIQITANQNLIIAAGIAYDAEIAATNAMFYAVAIEDKDRSRPLLTLHSLGGTRTLQNRVDGDPVTVKTLTTSTGVIFVLENAWGDAIPNGAGGPTPYPICANGLILPDGVNILRTGLISFKPQEGAALANKQDEVTRMSGVLSLLAKLLDACNEEGAAFKSVIR